jgi:hypothetical protein
MSCRGEHKVDTAVTRSLCLMVLCLMACGGTQPDPLQGDWTFKIGNNATGQQLDDGRGALRIRENGDAYSNADETVKPPVSQMFGAVRWIRTGNEVRLDFSSPSAIPIANPQTFVTAVLSADGNTMSGTFHDLLGDWNGATFTAHR